MNLFKKKKKETYKPSEPPKKERFEVIDRLGIKRSIALNAFRINPMLQYLEGETYPYTVCADELENILKKAFDAGLAISQATGHNYAKFDHKDAVSKEELSEALKKASEDLKIFKSSDLLSNLAKRIKEAGIK